MTALGKCRSCRADVLFLRSVTTGKVSPVDPSPVPDGNVEVDVALGTYRVLSGRARFDADPTARDPDAQPALCVVHFVTCRAAARHRRGARRDAPRQGVLLPAAHTQHVAGRR